MDIIPLLVCSLTLAVSLYTDLRFKKIPNALTMPVALSALFFFNFKGLNDGVVYVVKGFAGGGCLLLIPFMMGGIGGGDVKLLAALGAWLGFMPVVNVFFYSAITGGIISFIILLKQRSMSKLKQACIALVLCKLSQRFTGRTEEPEDSFPYSAPIAIGFIFYVMWGAIL